MLLCVHVLIVKCDWLLGVTWECGRLRQESFVSFSFFIYGFIYIWLLLLTLRARHRARIDLLCHFRLCESVKSCDFATGQSYRIPKKDTIIFLFQNYHGFIFSFPLLQIQIQTLVEHKLGCFTCRRLWRNTNCWHADLNYTSLSSVCIVYTCRSPQHTADQTIKNNSQTNGNSSFFLN